jgi:hypothetical protein
MAHKLIITTMDDESRESCSVFYSHYYLVVASNPDLKFKEAVFKKSNTKKYVNDEGELVDKAITELTAAGYTVEKLDTKILCLEE